MGIISGMFSNLVEALLSLITLGIYPRRPKKERTVSIKEAAAYLGKVLTFKKVYLKHRNLFYVEVLSVNPITNQTVSIRNHHFTFQPNLGDRFIIK